MHKAYFAGSFDPITLGHIALIKSGLAIFDHVTIGIGVHHEKASLFTADEKKTLIENSLDEFNLDSNRVDIQTFNGLLVDAAKAADAVAILRGLRTPSDFDYEMGMLDMNKSMMPDIETIFLTAPTDKRNLSSSLVRQIAKMGGDISPFVPTCVLQAFKDKK